MRITTNRMHRGQGGCGTREGHQVPVAGVLHHATSEPGHLAGDIVVRVVEQRSPLAVPTARELCGRADDVAEDDYRKLVLLPLVVCRAAEELVESVGGVAPEDVPDVGIRA